MQSTWLLAQPTPGQVRAGDPLADADFHHAMAARAPGLAILLGERLARSRGAGGRTVAGAWADSGADVTVIADADPRHRSGTRLLVDGAVAVEQWARDIRALGATGACWHADLDSPTDQAPLTATVAGAITRAGLAPMLWVTGPGSSVHDTDGIRAIGDLLDRAAADGADLGQLRVCLRVDPSAREWGGRLGSLVTGLSAAIPHAVAQVVVVVPRDRLHLAQSDAYELEHAMAHESAAWPLTHCAGDLALRQVGGWWREPGLARRAGNRFETIVGQLARPTGPVYVHRHESPAAPGETGDQPRTGSPRTFDTSLFRGRSLYRHRSTR